MSRHRGVRNRQYSYDEGEDEHTDDEAAAAEWEEQKQQQYEGGHTGSYYPGVGGNGSGNFTLSSYVKGTGTRKVKQRQQWEKPPVQEQQDPGQTGQSKAWQEPAGVSGKTETMSPPPAADGGEAEVIEAIADELERRLEKCRFSGEQIRQAVLDSQFDIDIAEAILLSSIDQLKQLHKEFPAPAEQPAQMKNEASDIVPSQQPGAFSDEKSAACIESSPSPLAFGLCVDGQENRRRSETTTLAPPAFGPNASRTESTLRPEWEQRRATRSTVSFELSFPSKNDGGDVKPFGFDTPSPDDLNLQKQALARTHGTVSGSNMDNLPSGHGERSHGSGDVNKTRLRMPHPKGEVHIPDIRSPKGKVVSISGSTGSTPIAKAREADSRGSTSAACRDNSFTGQNQSPRPAGGTGNRAIAQSQYGEDKDESDDDEAKGKERLAMVVIGHVDAGKSTLMGQVLVQLGHVSQRALHKQEKEAREAGKASFFLAWVMDEEQEERAHGVTIDVAQKHIETPTKLVTLLDAPGHRDFIPKMISGASAADAAVLVIPATAGEFESGFQANGQTKEHAMLAKVLGLNQLVVVVNKLDATDPPWSQERYEAVKAQVSPFLANTGFRPKKIRFLPASGISGENVSRRDPNGALAKWYDGPTLLEAIDAFTAGPRSTDKPFRMCVADVAPGGRVVLVSGRVVQGRVRSGDKVLVMPLEEPAIVARLERNGASANSARAGDNAEVFLSGIDPARIVVGNVLCKAGEALRVPTSRRFTAQIMTLPALEVPIIKGTEFQLHMHNLDVMAHCSKLISLNNNAGEMIGLIWNVPDSSQSEPSTANRIMCSEVTAKMRPIWIYGSYPHHVYSTDLRGEVR